MQVAEEKRDSSAYGRALLEYQGEAWGTIRTTAVYWSLQVNQRLVCIAAGIVLVFVVLLSLRGGVSEAPAARPSEQPRGTSSSAPLLAEPPDPSTARQSGSSPAIAPASSTADSSGALAVRVVDGEGGPIERGEVLLFVDANRDGAYVPREERSLYGRLANRYRVSRTGTIVDGRVLFAHVAPGEYKVAVNPTSLPEGLLPPWNQEAIAHEAVVVRAGTESSATLVARRAGLVYGFVYGPTGDPVAGAELVAGATARGAERLSATAISGADGSYSIRLYDGSYALRASAPRLDKFAEMPAPPPVEVTIDYATRAQIDFYFIRGSRVVRGRTVDGEGHPVGNIRVLAYYTRGREVAAGGDYSLLYSARETLTSETGDFALTGLHEAPIKLQFGIDQHALAGYPPPRVVDLAQGPPDVDVGDMTVERSSYYCIEGVLSFDEAWRDSDGLRDFKLLVVCEDSGEEERLRVSGEGVFRWHCEQGHGPIVLRAVSSLGAVEVPLVPRPSTVESVNIEYP